MYTYTFNKYIFVIFIDFIFARIKEMTFSWGVLMSDKHDDDKRYKKNTTQKKSCIGRENAGIEMTYFMFEK